MIPKSQGHEIELFVIQPIYKKEKVKRENEFGMVVKQEVDKFVKEVWARVWMDKNAIGVYGEYVGSKGELLKNRTLVFNKSTDSYYKVAHSVDELRQVMQYGSKQIGYKKPNNEI